MISVRFQVGRLKRSETSCDGDSNFRPPNWITGQLTSLMTHHRLPPRAAACFRLRICQQNHAATSADTPPILKTKPIESFDPSCAARAERGVVYRRTDSGIASAGVLGIDVVDGSPKNANCEAVVSVDHWSAPRVHTTIEDMKDVMTVLRLKQSALIYSREAFTYTGAGRRICAAMIS